MKKIFFALTLIITILLAIILFFSYYRQSEQEMKVYTILREYSYWYQDNRRFSFIIYSNQENSFLDYAEHNVYELKNEQMVFTLNHVEVYKELNDKENEESVYQFRIEADLINPKEQSLYIENAMLVVKNDQLSCLCRLGDITIYHANMKLLNVFDLYGNYAYIEDELHLVGISIAIKDIGLLKHVKIGSIDSCLEFVEKDVLYDSEVDYLILKHPIIREKKVNQPIKLDAKTNYYFIPFSYEELRLITSVAISFNINDEEYILDTFSFYASPIRLCNYPHLSQKGEIQYA